MCVCVRGWVGCGRAVEVPVYRPSERRLDCFGDSRILQVSEVWDICPGETHREWKQPAKLEGWRQARNPDISLGGIRCARPDVLPILSPCHILILPFWNGNIFCITVCGEHMACFLIFTVGLQIRETALSFKRSLIFKHCRVCKKILGGILRLGWMHFTLWYGHKPMEEQEMAKDTGSYRLIYLATWSLAESRLGGLGGVIFLGRCATWVSSEAPGMFSTSCMQIDVVFQMLLSPRTLSLEARSPITRFYL